MGPYVVRRLLQTLIVVLGVVTLVFFLLRLSGDPATLFAAADASPEDIERVRQRLGLDRPLPVQYISYLGGILQGDFGQSLRFQKPVSDLLLERLPATMELTLVALAGGSAIAIPLGVIAAVKRGTLVDNFSMGFTLLGQSVPVFFLGILLLLIFAVELGWLPASGRGTPQQLILPAITLGAFSLARIARLTRSAMLEVLGQDYVRTARAKGLLERIVLIRHALRNASVVIITIVGLGVAQLIGGAVITETIFSWPGLGRLIVSSVYARDYAVVQGGVIVIAIFVATINLIVDLLYGYLDPRIRLGAS